MALSKKKIDRLFREGVFGRDRETCVLCKFQSQPGFSGAEFEAFRLVSDYLTPVSRINAVNGVTLCRRVRPGCTMTCAKWAETQLDAAGGCTLWFDMGRREVLASAAVRFRADVVR